MGIPRAGDSLVFFLPPVVFLSPEIFPPAFVPDRGGDFNVFESFFPISPTASMLVSSKGRFRFRPTETIFG